MMTPPLLPQTCGGQDKLDRPSPLPGERDIWTFTQTKKQADGPLPYNTVGVILFSDIGQLLFMNDKVSSFIQRLQPSSTREFGACLIPIEVHTVVRQLAQALRAREHPVACRSLHAQEIFPLGGQQLLVRGWCIPDGHVVKKSRFVIVLEILPQRAMPQETKIQDRYHLTEREQMVVIYLMLGFTNKEIANRLNLSEHTVKEHLKRMMQKTQTTSRTGLLSCMIFPISERGGPYTKMLPLAPPAAIQSHDRHYREQ